jgi:sodium transport system permease protein
MRALLAVFRKEFRENLRDRRTLLTAILLGPVLGPLALAGLLQFVAQREQSQSSKSLEVAVVQAARAPRLIEYLTANNIDIKRVELDDAAAQQAVQNREHRVVLSVPEDFAERLADSSPAPLLLYYDAANVQDTRSMRRVTTVVAQYSQTVAQLRLTARGIDPGIVAAIALQGVDVSTPRSRAETPLGMLSYIVIIAALLGGVYLATDTTAGERERGSLEPLLTTPVAREQIVYGKILATSAFMLISLTLTLTTVALALSRVDLDGAGIAIDFGPGTVLRMIATTAPFIPLAAGLMTLVASFTRSYREAQSWLGVAMIVPTLPLAIASVLALKPGLATMAIPSLSQHFLMMAALRGDSLPLSWIALSAGVSLALTVLVWWLVGRLYQREAILG